MKKLEISHVNTNQQKKRIGNTMKELCVQFAVMIITLDKMRSNLLQQIFHIALETRKIEKLLPILPVRGKKAVALANFDSWLYM